MDPVVKIIAIVVAAGAVILLTLFQFSPFGWEHQEAITSVLTSFAVLAVLIVLWRLAFATTSLTAQSPRAGLRRALLYPRAYRYARGILVLLTLVGVGAGLHYGQTLAMREKIVVLVARLDGHDPKTSQATEKFVSALSESLAGLGDVGIQRLERVSIEGEGSGRARALGTRYRTALALWPRYSAESRDTPVGLDVENLAQPKTLRLSPLKDHVVEAVLAESNHFVFQQPLAEDVGTLGLFIRAIVHYDRDDYAEAVHELSVILDEGGPENLTSQVLLTRGNANLVQRKPRDAIEDYSRALQINPTFAQAYTNRGIAYSDLGQQSRAIEDYARAIQVNSRETAAYLDRGVSYAALGNHQMAIEDYTRALRIDPREAVAYLDRGVSHAAQGNHQRAIEDYGQALRINPRDSTAYLNRGLSYEALRNHQEAIKDFSRAVQINPRDAIAYISRGASYAALGNYRRAVEDYSRALQIDPRTAAAFYQRGVAYSVLRKSQQAAEDLSHALEIDPRDANAYRDRGVNRLLLGKQQEAIEDASRAIQINPGDAQTYYNRALSHIIQGEPQKAMADLEKVLELSRDPSLRKYAEEQLRKLRKEQ